MNSTSEKSEQPALQALDPQKEEEHWILQVLQWLTYAGVFVLIAIGIKSILSEHLRHGYILFVFALLMMLNLVILHRTGSGNTFLRIFIGIVAALFIYLVATGGESNTGPLWFYVFPPLIFYMLGLRQGLVVMTSCLLVIAVIFKFPELPFVITEYNPDFQLRFLTSMTFVTVFSYILDFSRRRARNDLIDLAERYDLASRTDELTRLSNRRDMRNRLDTEYYRFKRHGHHFSVVLMDIDHFKRINDGYGHDAGDEVLKDFAKLLKEHSRHLDVISRWGGEEFLILLPETSLVQALALAERLRFAVESAEFSYQSMLIPVTMSAGVCSISQFESIEGLLRQTDINLYEAKMKGRNRIVPMVKSTSRPEEHDSESV